MPQLPQKRKKMGLFRIAPLFFKEKWHFDEFLIGIILALNGIVIAALEMIMISTIEKKRSGIFFIIVGGSANCSFFRLIDITGSHSPGDRDRCHPIFYFRGDVCNALHQHLRD
jgi:hypothetical protein